jgi:glycerol-3-phosphate acyltransferase PlsY
MVLGLYPYYTIPGAVAFVVWAVLVLIFRYVSLASIAAAVAFPIALVAAIIIKPGWQLAGLWPLILAALIMPALVILRHVENIKRLLDGSETKVLQ